MKIWRRQNRKLNNAGMTLVEVIVAIVILSVAILPILHTFLSSTIYNARSRTRQQTTAAAQTVLENFKAYSVKEICDQFAKVDGKSFSVSGGVETQIVDPATHTLVSGPIPGGNMDFRILDMVYQNEHYDVEVNLKSHSSLAADMEALIYENRSSQNAAAYVGLQSMDADALAQIAEEVAVVWTNEESTAAPAPSASPAPAVTHSGSEVDTSKIKITNREIKIDFKKSGDNYIAEVSCEYQYQVDNYQYGVDETGTPRTFSIPSTTYQFDMDSGRSELSKEIFNQPIDSSDHLNLTVLYYPAYSRGTGSAVKIASDKITILNSTDKDIRCYLYKQKNLAVSDTRVSFSELDYHVNLNLAANVKIYDDNLDIVLGSPTSVAPGGYDSMVDTGVRYRGIGYAARNMEYPDASDAAPAMPADLSAETVENLRQMYDITVTVYSKGSLPNDGSAIPASVTPLNILESTIIE